MAADELPLAGLEVVEQASMVEGVQAGEERRLTRRACPVAWGWGRHQPVVESVRGAGTEAIDHLGAPVGVPLIRAGVERVELAGLQGTVKGREHERFGVVVA